MADVKISDLPAAANATGTQEFEVNDSGTSRRVTGNQLDNLLLGTTNGLVARTGTNARAARTITAGNGIIISNGNGVSGNPTVSANVASQAEAEAGTAADKLMTPQRTAQAIAELAGGGGLVPIGAPLAVTTPVSAIDFTLPSGYLGFRIHFFAVEHDAGDTANRAIWIRTSSDSGSSFDAGASDYLSRVIILQATNTIVTTLDPGSRIATNTFRGNGKCNGFIEVMNPAATEQTYIFGQLMPTGTFWTPMYFNGTRLAASAVNAVRLLLDDTGGITGTFQLYGINGGA